MSQSYKVPFSWEYKPGVSKVIKHQDSTLNDHFTLNLSPSTSCLVESQSPQNSTYNSDRHLPLPPCAFRAPSRNSSKKGLGLGKQEDDPFFAAYKECTKSTETGYNKVAENGAGSGSKKGVLKFSCRQSCSVVDHNLVRVSQLHPYYGRDAKRLKGKGK